jgi:DNA-binding transcriptional ArsR family regulator
MLTETVTHALADPTRLRVMQLFAHKELAVGELAQVLGQSEPRISGHVDGSRSSTSPPTSARNCASVMPIALPGTGLTTKIWPASTARQQSPGGEQR